MRSVELSLQVDGPEGKHKDSASPRCERQLHEQRSTHLGAEYYKEAERLKGCKKKLHELRIHNLPS